MQMSLRTTAAVLTAAGLTLAACGASDSAAPATGVVPTESAAPITEPALAPSAETPAEEATAEPESDATDVTAAPSAEPVDPAPDSVPVSEPAPVATEPPAPAAAVLGGRALASELATESDFAENVLPDIQVDDIRAQTKVNLRNVFPAERPVLFWLWAPH